MPVYRDISDGRGDPSEIGRHGSAAWSAIRWPLADLVTPRPRDGFAGSVRPDNIGRTIGVETAKEAGNADENYQDAVQKKQQ